MIAFIVVQVGGAKAVRSVCYIAGLPMAIVSFLVMFSVYKMLRKDFRRKTQIPFMPDYDLGEGKQKLDSDHT